jgi:hypothetical protein
MSVLDDRPVPTGPADAEASTPTLKFPLCSAFIPLSVLTSATSSVDCPPICAPRLPPPMRMGAGALHSPLEVRHVA